MPVFVSTHLNYGLEVETGRFTKTEKQLMDVPPQIPNAISKEENVFTTLPITES